MHTSSDLWDHPRLRGEKCHYSLRPPILKGSSPLARGKVPVNFCACNPYGIIPACAGKRRQLWDNNAIKRDHPRLRGEKYALYSAFWLR